MRWRSSSPPGRRRNAGPRGASVSGSACRSGDADDRRGGRGGRAAAETALVFVGRNGEWDTEGSDLLDIALPGRQDELIARRRRGEPADRRGAADRRAGRDALARRRSRRCWRPGIRARKRATPSPTCCSARPSRGGRLPQSFPVKLGRQPDASQDREVYPGLDGKVRYEEGVFIGYRHYDRPASRRCSRSASGSGYTRFELSDLWSTRRTFTTAGQRVCAR